MFSLPQSTADLPIHEKLDALLDVLLTKTRAVLVAPPGAGKTTIVPLALLNAPWRDGRKIIVLEPRRLAARNAATRMASLLDEPVGATVGYRVRLETKVSARAQIEVVTEGVFTRMLSSDPGLENVACVLFDEFHERSLDSDLALALCLDLQTGLREDLRLVPMSATLDGAKVSNIINADVIESQGRQYPVEIEYREGRPREAAEAQMAGAVLAHLRETQSGNVLCFLPGQREIERTFDQLKDRLPENVQLHRLYGSLPPAEQDAAIRPNKDGHRKVILSSAIAETSLTIDGVSTVIDSGLARHPVHEPATGLTRLQTVRADQASITQRAGRAGRLGPGKAVRLWREQQTATLPKAAIPEILNADLTSLVLDLADWGVNSTGELTWIDVPPIPAWNEAKSLLVRLGAFSNGSLTDHGKALSRLSLSPRLAHMVLTSSSPYDAALLALLLQERGVGGTGIDLETRWQNLSRGKDKRSQQLQGLAKRLVRDIDARSDVAESIGLMLARAFPDRIAQRGAQSPNGAMRYTLANGRGAELDAADGLATNEFLVVADMIGRTGSARIVAAVSLEKSEIWDHLEDQIEINRQTRFDKQKGELIGEECRVLGALKLEKPKRFKPNPQDVQSALAQTIHQQGLSVLPWQKTDLAVLEKLRFMEFHNTLSTQNLFTDQALLNAMDDWLVPFLTGRTALGELADGTISQALLLHAGMNSTRELDQKLPVHFAAPTGSKIPIQYHADKAVIALRPQELFGLDVHPKILNNSLALEIELLSPAGRPIQITRDLPGFWRGSWSDVRADLRGRYPKHPWPENPQDATPTSRVKPRKK